MARKEIEFDIKTLEDMKKRLILLKEWVIAEKVDEALQFIERISKNRYGGRKND